MQRVPVRVAIHFFAPLLATLLAAPLFAWPTAARAAEWEYQSMQGVHATCIEADAIHGRVFVGTYEGFHYVDLTSGTWVSRDWSGWIGREVHSIDWHAGIDQRVITGRENAFFKGYIELSNDLGASEQHVYDSNGGRVTGLGHDPADPDHFYACTWSDVAPGEIVRSLDGGVHWTLLSGTIQYAMTSLTIDATGTVYVGGSERVTRSLDGGDTWETASSGLPSGYGVYCVTADPEESGRLLASNDLGLYRSLDGGDTWTQMLAVDCRAIDWAAGGWVVPGLHAARPAAVVTWDGRILVSHNVGGDWQDVTGDLSGTPVDLAFSEFDGLLYVATTDAGTFRADVIDFAGLAESHNAAASALTLRLPAPFRAGDVIRFHLPGPGAAALTILDVSGRCVATLREGGCAAGDHQLRWNGDGQSEGLYWAVLHSAHGVTATRLVLVR